MKEAPLSKECMADRIPNRRVTELWYATMNAKLSRQCVQAGPPVGDRRAGAGPSGGVHPNNHLGQ